MKKRLKIIAIGCVIFAIVANLHTAIFSFYGIKSHNLGGEVWAQSTSTSTSEDGDETSRKEWDFATYTTTCSGGAYTNTVVTVTSGTRSFVTTINGAGQLIGQVGVGFTSSGSTTTTHVSSGVTGPYVGTGQQCIYGDVKKSCSNIYPCN